MAGLIANRPMKVTRGIDEVSRSRKPKEQNGKPIGIMRDKEKVNRPRKPKE